MIYLLQPHDATVGAAFEAYVPATEIGLLFKWRSPDDLSFRDFVLQVSDTADFSGNVITALTNGQISENAPLDNAPPLFYGYLAESLAQNTSYFWRVGYNDGGVYSNFSNIGLLHTTFAAPTLINVDGDNSIRGNSAQVSWETITDPAISDVIINYGTETGNFLNFVTFPSQPAICNVTGLVNGSTVFFAAQAAGNVEYDVQEQIAPVQLRTVQTEAGDDIILDDYNYVVIHDPTFGL